MTLDTRPLARTMHKHSLARPVCALLSVQWQVTVPSQALLWNDLGLPNQLHTSLLTAVSRWVTPTTDSVLSFLLCKVVLWVYNALNVFGGGEGESCVKIYKNVCSYSQQLTFQSSQPEWFHIVLRRQSFLSPNWLKQIPLLFPAHWRFIPPLSPPVHLNLWQHLPPVPTEVTSLRAPWRTRAHLNWILEQHLIQALQNHFWHLNPLLLLMFPSYIRLVRELPRTRHPYSTEAQLELLVSAVSPLVFFVFSTLKCKPVNLYLLMLTFSRCQIIFGAFWRKVPGA